MMKRLFFIVVAVMISLIGAGQSFAANELSFDSAHSRFYFTINHIFSKVIGHFEEFSGTIMFDPDNLAASRMDIDIEAKSIDTDIRKRDNHLRSEDFFEVNKYPLITFRSKRISHLGGNQYEVKGEFTIKDVKKTVTLPLTYFGTKDNPFNKDQLVVGFEVNLTIDRLQYNVGSGKFYNLGVAGKDVDILVSLDMFSDK